MTNHAATATLEPTLRRHGVYIPSGRELPLGPEHRTAALCYIREGARVLLLQRKEPPFVSRWTAPGGKVRRNELPDDAVRREILEETGLTLVSPQLRLVVIESGPEPLLNWLLYVYRADAFHGRLQSGDEGPLEWVAVDDLHRVGMPDVDLIVSRYALADDGPHLLEVVFDSAERTSHLSVTPLPAL